MFKSKAALMGPRTKQYSLRIAVSVVASLFIGGLIGPWVVGSNQPLDGVGNADGSLGGDYGYLHTSRFFIIDRDGELVDAMRHSTTSNELAARLTQYTGAQLDQG